jgi:hypothetical protein
MTPTPFNPAWRVPHDHVTAATCTRPNVVVAIGLVGHGYQVDYYVDGTHQASECRDFESTHEIGHLEHVFSEAIAQGIEKARKML